jgi:hypothetical protein
MYPTVVDRIHQEFQDLISYLDQGNQPSLRSTVDENFRKALLLAAASYFEHRIVNDILTFVREASRENNLLIEFVNNKAISRQYHTFFNWNETNANQFFGLFGTSFKNFIKQELRTNEQLNLSIKAFLEIGRERNRLVHQDFGTFSLEKTSEEIYELYKIALIFVEIIPVKLRECLLPAQSNNQ